VTTQAPSWKGGLPSPITSLPSRNFCPCHALRAHKKISWPYLDGPGRSPSSPLTWPLPDCAPRPLSYSTVAHYHRTEQRFRVMLTAHVHAVLHMHAASPSPPSRYRPALRSTAPSRRDGPPPGSRSQSRGTELRVYTNRMHRLTRACCAPQTLHRYRRRKIPYPCVLWRSC
jgi:hypothetical protein